MARVGVFSGTVTRTWSVPGAPGGGSYGVVLNHHTVSGSRVVSVDGQELEDTVGTNHLFQAPAELPFDLGEKKALMRIAAVSSNFMYVLTVDGEVVKEENEVVGGTSGSRAEGTKTYSYDVHVPSTEMGVDEHGEKVVWYAIHTVRTLKGGDGPRREVTCHRRFRDFVGVNEQIRSSYKGSHLLSSLPKPPARGFKMFSDHFSDKFIEDRRTALEEYLRRMAGIPRAFQNQDLLNFIGVMDTTRETSVLIGDGALGISLGMQGQWVTLMDFKPVDGGHGPVQRSRRVAQGDRVSKINGESVLGLDKDDIAGRVRAARRPIMLHFLGYFPIIVDDEDDGGDADGAAGVSGGAGGASGAAAETAEAGAEEGKAGGAGDDAASEEEGVVEEVDLTGD